MRIDRDDADYAFVETIKRWIRRSDTFATIGLFFFLLKYKLGYDRFFEANADLLETYNWTSFIKHNGIMLPMAVVILSVFIIIRSSAKQELDHASTMFSALAMPQAYKNIIGYKLMPIAVVFFYVMFFSFALIIDRPALLSAGLLAWNALDLTVARLTRVNLNRYLNDPHFDPPDEDPLKPWILQRRDVGRAYLFHWFYVPRIWLIACGNVVALLLSTGWPIPAHPTLAYCILMGLLIGNEIVMGSWRWTRERRLAQILREERRMVRSRTREGM